MHDFRMVQVHNSLWREVHEFNSAHQVSKPYSPKNLGEAPLNYNKSHVQTWAQSIYTNIIYCIYAK